MAIIKSKHASNYTVIPNELFKQGLSIEAIGLLTYLISLPHDWVIYKTKLHEQLNIGRDKLDRVFKELQTKGYVLSVERTNEKGLFEWEHIVYDKPYNGEPQSGNPCSEEQLLLSTNKQSTNYKAETSSAKSKLGKKILFKDSPIHNKKDFLGAFPDWSKEKLAYYYDAVLTWSNEGNKKVDWVATVRTWAKRDELQGKIKFDKKNINYGNLPAN